MVDRLVHSEVNSRRVANVEHCFGKGGMSLNGFGRVLVGEGVLMKKCRKKPKQRQFFLFNDILVYGNIVISKKRYNKQRVIQLEHVKLEDVPDDGDLKNGWHIKTPSKSFAVYAATATEKKEWMIHIERCVADIIAKGKQSATEHAPVWVPDREAQKCMACEKTQFSIVQRRHHCRACGKVVCGHCSSHSYKIDAMKKKPVRVCDQCFIELTTANGVDSGTDGDMSPHRRSPKEGSESSSDSEDEGGNDISRPTFYREELAL